ncbi:hypothetical protein BGZ73_001409 [Actinomortierella ambigua]|nr:hypothetical protein BGZ73_001409 [Actinomortierella ambigua]
MATRYQRIHTSKLKVDNSVDIEETPTTVTMDQIRSSLFGHQFGGRWALSASVKEPDCVSFGDHGLGTTRIEKMGHVFDDLQPSAEPEAKKTLSEQGEEAAEAYDLEAQHSQQQQQTSFHAAVPIQPEVEEQVKVEKEPELVDDMEEHDWLEDDIVTTDSGDSSSSSSSSHKSTLDADKIAEVAGEVAQEMLEDEQHKIEPRMLNRRDRTMARHHHHHRSSVKAKNKIQLETQKEPHSHDQHRHEKRQDAPKVGSTAKQEVLMHQQLTHAEHPAEEKFPAASVVQESKSAPASENQRVLAQAGSSDSTSKQSDQDGVKSNSQESPESTPSDGPKKSILLLAVVPIMLLMAAIAGFTAYRRHYENPFNQGGRNDTRDGIPSDEGYHRRDVPLRKGSPIHFDRTFINAMHSPPPAATYLHDPDYYHNNNQHHHSHRSHSNSRHHSPTSPPAAVTAMARPPPSAGSLGKSRFQELNRSYDFGAGLRSIRQAFSRSQNASKEAGLDYGQCTRSSASLHENGSSGGMRDGLYPGVQPGTNYALGVHRSGGSGNHGGATSAVALGKQRAMDNPHSRSGSGGDDNDGALYGSTSYRDIQSMAGPSTTQEHTIVWGQYSATDDDPNYDTASQSLAAHLAKRSVSSNTLSILNASALFGAGASASASTGGGGNSTSKYTHHQPCLVSASSHTSLSMVASGHSPFVAPHATMNAGGCPQSPADSIGNCLSPSDSPVMSREEHMRRQSLMANQYAFDSDEADSYSSRDLLFDAREHLPYDEKSGKPIASQDQAKKHQHQQQQKKRPQSFFGRLRSKKSKDQSVPEMAGHPAGAATTAADDDEEMDMYLRMEKEISPEEEAVFDVLQDDGSHPRDASLIIQKSAPLSHVDSTIVDEKSEIRAMAAVIVEVTADGAKKMKQDEHVWNEKVGLEIEAPPTVPEAEGEDKDEDKHDKHSIHDDDAVVPVAMSAAAPAVEETHVLGSASPASSHGSCKDSAKPSSHSQMDYEAAPAIPATEPNRQLLNALGRTVADVDDDDEEEETAAMEEEEYPFDRDEWEENPKKPDQNPKVLKASGGHGSSASLNKKKKKNKKGGRRK